MDITPRALGSGGVSGVTPPSPPPSPPPRTGGRTFAPLPGLGDGSITPPVSLPSRVCLPLWVSVTQRACAGSRDGSLGAFPGHGFCSLNRAQGGSLMFARRFTHSLTEPWGVGPSTPPPHPLTEWMHVMSAHSPVMPLARSLAYTEPPRPRAMDTRREWCRYWQAMDRHYATAPDSPLHHDYRCDAHPEVHACRSQCDDCHTHAHCTPGIHRRGDLLLCDSCVTRH